MMSPLASSSVAADEVVPHEQSQKVTTLDDWYSAPTKQEILSELGAGHVCAEIFDAARVAMAAAYRKELDLSPPMV